MINLIEHVVLNCKKDNNLADARTFLRIATENCRDLVSLDRMAFIQSELKDYENCVSSLKKCLEIGDPNSRYAIRANIAKMYNHLNEPMMSLAYSKMNLAEQFEYDTVMEMAFSYYLMGNYAESEKMMRELITHENLPEEIQGRVEYNLGSYDIERGEFKRGLKGFIEVGHRIKIWPERYIPDIPVWNGESISGKTVIIHAEGGIGDELINVRFVNNLKKLGANPVWVTNNPQLLEVFNRNSITAKQSVDYSDQLNSVQCMAMRLPILLGLDRHEVWNGAYLKPAEEYIKKWEKLLPAGRKLAVKWSGNPHYDQDLHRSIPLQHIQNIQFNGTKINLQLEPELFQPDMFNAGRYISSIEDTLAILYLCDDLISSCTSVAHMAGAIGKNGTVCPPIACYYVWLGNTGRSDWYDSSLKVVRQTKHRDWSFVEDLI